MDGRLNAEPSTTPVKPLWQMLDEVCPMYIAMGMTYEQFWYGDPTAVAAYREADRLRQQRANTEAWLQGMYIYDALVRVAPYFNSLKPKPPKEYPSQPYELRSKASQNRTNDAGTMTSEEKKTIIARDIFFAKALAYNKKFKGKKGEADVGRTEFGRP